MSSLVPRNLRERDCLLPCTVFLGNVFLENIRDLFSLKQWQIHLRARWTSMRRRPDRPLEVLGRLLPQTPRKPFEGQSENLVQLKA